MRVLNPAFRVCSKVSTGLGENAMDQRLELRPFTP